MALLCPQSVRVPWYHCHVDMRPYVSTASPLVHSCGGNWNCRTWAWAERQQHLKEVESAHSSKMPPRPGTNGPQENFGSLRHAAACFKLLVKGTIIFRKRHRFQKPDQNTVNHMAKQHQKSEICATIEKN